MLGASAVAAQPDASVPAQEVVEARHLAAGVRFGVMPPIGTVIEVLVRPVPHLAFGVFGMKTPDKTTIGAELALEVAGAGESTPYAQVAYLDYRDTSPQWERSKVLYVTAGYIWKSRLGAELQLGAGGLLIVSEDLPACTGWFCFRPSGVPILPALELALRYGFL